MKDKLEKALSKKRYEHSIGVCDEAVKLAKKYGADVEKAYTAGLLHDCAKGFDTDTQIKLCREYGIMLDDITLSCTAVIHAPLGAVVANREYGIDDDEILEAIRNHTTGKEGMSLLDKIIYIADMIEPLRDYSGVDVLRKAAYEDIDKACIMGLKHSIVFNANKNKIIPPDTIFAWNDMVGDTK